MLSVGDFYVKIRRMGYIILLIKKILLGSSKFGLSFTQDLTGTLLVVLATELQMICYFGD